MKKTTLIDFEKNHIKKLKSWRYSLALLFGMLFMGIPSFAQTIQVGSGTSTNSYLPLYYLYDKNYTQTIYNASELVDAGATATGGIITKIRFKSNTSVSTVDWKDWVIYMDNTAKVGFSSTTDWVPLADLTQVFNGSIQANLVANEWMEITLDTPFVWDGSNVVIAIAENTEDWGNSPSWTSYTLAPASGSKGIYYYADGATVDPATPPTAKGISNNVAQIQFDGTLQEGCTGTPSGGTASLSTNTGNAGSNFTASATGVTGASGLTYQWQKEISGTWQDIVGATSKTSVITAESGAIGIVTNYRLAVTCTSSTEVAYSTVVPFTIQLVYCTSVPTSNDNSGITYITLGTAGFPVADVMYYDHPTTVDLMAGITNQVAVTFGTGYTYHTNIWIDLNDNGTFESNELVFQGESTNANPTIFDASFYLDASTLVGLHKMRIGTADSGQATPNPCYSGGFGVTVDVMVNILPPPACLPPSALTATNITSNSADLSWTSAGTLFDIQWGPQGFAIGSGTIVPGVAKPYTLTLPTPNTKYSYYVRQDCGATDGVSIWSGPYTFTTACGVVAAFTENFDSYTATGSANPLPNCWTRFGNTGSSYITTGSSGEFSGPNRLLLTGATTGATNGVAVMPAVSNLQAETHRLRFMAYATTAGKSLEIGYYSDLEDASSFNFLTAIEMPSTAIASAQEFTFAPQSVPAGVQSLVFRVNGGASTTSTTVYIDNVYWEVLPSCFDITDITFSEITTSQAVVAWENGGTEGAWEYVYELASVATSPVGLTPVLVEGTPYDTLENLLPAKKYNFWIRSVCSPSLKGNWSLVQTFTTACGLVETFSETFEGLPTGSVNPLALCWERAGNGSVYITTGGPTGQPNRLYMFANGSTPTVAYAIMPSVSNLQAETHRLKFNVYASTANKYIEIGVLTDPTDVTTFSLLQTINVPGTTLASAQTFTFSPVNIPTGINTLVFRNPGTPTESTALYIDDVKWEAKPTVVPSCSTNVLAVPNATYGNFPTVITWDANAAADTYFLNIGTTPGGVDVVNNANIGLVTTYSFIGSIATTYYYTLIPFNTAGSAVGCVEQTFTTLPAGGYCTSAPTGNDNSGITNVQVGTQNFPTADVSYFDHTATAVDLAQGVTSNLKVTFATGYTYGTNVWVDFNDNFTFEASELVFQGESTNANPTTYDASFLMPANAPLGMHQMRIGTADVLQTPPNPCYSGSYGVTLDFKINVTPAPSCLAPMGLSVDAASVTTNSATVSWIASTSLPSQGYEYYYSTSSVAPTASTTPSGSVAAGITVANLTGLSTSSLQYVYVRSACSTTDFSAWSQPVTFATLCDVTSLPYSVNFETVTVPNLPPCTLNENVGTGNNWLTVANPGYGFTSKALRYQWNTSNAANVWFYTNLVNLVAGTQYTVSYKYGGSSTTYTENLKVAYGSAANSTAMTNVLADHPGINTTLPQNNAVTFTPAVSGTYVIGFQAYSPSNQFYLLLDDIMIEEADLATGDFNTNKFTAYPNPVKNNLNIRYNENIKDVAVFNLLGQQLFTKSINANEGQIDMSGVPSGTYLVKISSADKVQTIKVIKE
ncbi:GEVED domain-containing protein [Flavobacterium antarcticum]|uniref:GEVED domain-containing protein n=1 Tax=Flavobacterium antarcticum TaxID=271155 RepID=UPI0003B6E899|nr:GEVED domain-containing protein [Flavobacterium antarcticum]